MNFQHSRPLYLFLALLSFTCLPAVMGEGAFAENETHFLIEGSGSGYQIALHAHASPSERFAAEELQHYIKVCSDVTLPITEITEEGDRPMILLGCGPVAEALGVAPDPAVLGEQGYLMKTVAPHLVIAGSPEAGTLYGVYDFLETYLNVRWFAPEVTQTPQIEELLLPITDTLKKPAFLWRHTSYAWPGGDSAFLARVRDNQGSGGGDHAFGVQHHHDGRCHSYFWYVSPSEYFEEHPEYFSEIGGVRRSHETQLCLTNPDVLEIVAEKILQRMKDRPEARQHNFSQMDYYNYCECDKCRAINEQYGTMGGTQYWFLNQLAERTVKIYPEKLIGTLAYMYTEEPPKDFEMHPNVAVWLCHMFPSCDSHPIATCPLNADYKRRAEAWSKITRHLYIWHYVVNFAHYYVPFPNFGALASDMRFYRDIGVEGIYLQGMGHGGGGGEFSVLRPWYLMKLAWNPDADSDTLLEEFLKGYYREAWEPIREYIALLQDKVDAENIHMHLYTNPATGYLTDEVMVRAASLFDQAEERAAQDEDLLERVRVARMPLTYANCFPRNGYRIENENLHFNPPIASMDEISAFVKRMENHGFSTIRERFGEPDQMLMLGMVFNIPLEAPRISNEYLDVDIAPFLGGRVLRIIDRKSGECVTGYNLSRNLFFPFCGGEETRLGGQYDIEGMFYQFGLLERSANSMVLLAEAGEWLIKRSISLDTDAPVIRFEVEVENLSSRERETILRSHTNYDLGSLASLRASFTNRKGERVERFSGPIIAGLREGEPYRDQNAPKGEWRLTGDKGFEIVQRFEDERLDYAWLYAYPDYLNDLESELWAKPMILKSGESTRFTYELEVVSKVE